MTKGFDFIGVSVVNMCHDGQGKYLIAQRGEGCRDEQGTWEPAGSGGVKHLESLEDAIKREVREECGSSVKHSELMGFREVFREIDGKPSHWIAFDFRTEIEPSEVSITEPDKCSDFRWCSIDEIPDPKHSQFPYFLSKYRHLL